MPKARKQLKESQAWREIARRIEVGAWRGMGLCVERCRLYWDESRISLEVFARMGDRQRAHFLLWEDTAIGASAPQWGFYWPAGKAGPRIIACELLALEAEAEGL